MNSRPEVGMALIILLTVLLCGGCAARQLTVQPMKPAGRGPIKLEVKRGAWPGQEAVTAITQPLEVSVENRSAEPLAFDARAFSLLTEDGRYNALPPEEIEERVVVSSAGGGRGFNEKYEEFLPLWGCDYAADPRCVTYSDPFTATPVWIPGTRQDVVTLPTPDMLALALPEGPIPAHGSISGYLFFQKPAAEEQAELVFEPDRPGESVRIPLAVEQGERVSAAAIGSEK